MSERRIEDRNARARRNTALACVAVFFAMVGAAYAAVPLYALFCQVTGYGGTTQRVDQYSDKVLDREIVLEDLDVAKYDIFSHQNEHIVRLTPEQLKQKMAEKEAAAKRA